MAYTGRQQCEPRTIDDAGIKLTHTELDSDARKVAEGLLETVQNPRTKAA